MPSFNFLDICVRLAYDARTTTIQARVCHVTPIVGPTGAER